MARPPHGRFLRSRSITSAVATIVLAVALAFVFGYALTIRGVLRAGVDLRTALKVALAADTVSSR